MSLPSGPRALALTFALLGLVATLDGISDHEIRFSLLYLLPILLAGWRVGKRWGFVVAAAATATWLAVDRSQAAQSGSAVCWNATMRLGVFGVTALLIGRLREEVELARTDALTRLPNRRAFVEVAELELARARRYGRGFSVVYLDADRFKELNDTRGHRAGNEALQAAAAAMRASLRDTDLPARIGGDEFAVLLPETDAAQATALVERLRANVTQKLSSEGFALTFSVGVASYLRDVPVSVAAMLSDADASMYEAKRRSATR